MVASILYILFKLPNFHYFVSDITIYTAYRLQVCIRFQSFKFTLFCTLLD